MHWYHDYVDHVLGYFPFRASHEGDNVIPRNFERPIPPPFVPGAERSAIFYDSNIIAYEAWSASLFEDGIGLVAEYSESLLSIGAHSTTILLWARVGGVEYGQRPTVADRNSWAEVKRDLAD